MSVTCNMCDDTVDADDPPVPNKILSTNNDNNNVDADSTVNVIGRLPTYLSNYFKIKEVKGTSLIVECTQCIYSKTLSTPLNSTGNLYKHLRRLHPAIQKSIKQVKDKSLSENNSQLENNNKLQNKKSLWTANIKNEEKKKEKVNKLIEQFIIQKMQPISLVEDPYFIELIEGISGIKPICRRTLQNHLLTDIWSANNKSYMGVTRVPRRESLDNLWI
ncbi:hypothetical protein CAJAP_01549 [Camponotus japonicus]